MAARTGLSRRAAAGDARVASLANGVRVLTLSMPWMEGVSVGVFVRTGSSHESARLNGISHVVEHMAFKGTHTRDAARINLDAERLGAEVNAYTDKDHTAYHLRGLARNSDDFVRMLGDIVLRSSFPADELERERQVILHEYVEDEEDALSNAFRLFDRACFGMHPLGQPVIGTRRNIERFTRADLQAYVDAQYTGANLVVGVAGPIDHDAVARQVEAAFGAMPAGRPNEVAPPAYAGGVRSRRIAGCSQSHLVIGFPIPTLRDESHHAAVVAAAVFGEGMSSPLMQELREKRGLVYYAACSADVMEQSGQFVVEASTSPRQLDEVAREVRGLLSGHARAIDAVALERARHQIAVRRLHARERPLRRLEDAAQDLFVHGRLRSEAELDERLQAVDAAQVRAAFAAMTEWPASVAVAGSLGRGSVERLRESYPQR